MKKKQFSGCTIGLMESNCFEKLTPEETELLETNSVSILYKKGETICKQGSLATHIIYMVNGLAKVYLEDGINSLVLKIVPNKSMIGLTSISEENNTFQFSAMAYLDSQVMQIDINIFRQLLSSNTDFAKSIFEVLNSNSTLINSRFFCLTQKQTYGRLADVILCLSQRIFKSPAFELQLSRKELAELSGTSPETLIRMLKKFRDDKLVKVDTNFVQVLDMERLQKISENG